MKKYLFLFLTVGIFASCDKDDNTPKNTDSELLGNWKLIEILADPGDGSGTFSPVDSYKTITFYEDGTVASNGTLCDMSLDSNNPTSGTYAMLDSTFSSSDCTNAAYDFQFEYTGNILIITYPCFEPCKAKYGKE